MNVRRRMFGKHGEYTIVWIVAGLWTLGMAIWVLTTLYAQSNGGHL